MTKKILLLVMMHIFICINAQNKTILIAESQLPYTQQKWFYSGVGKSPNESDIKSNWDEGYRITSAAYTSKGWFFSMSKGSGIGMQTYIFKSDWPDDWIKKNWDDQYYISAISHSNSQWLVVMSKGIGFTGQSWNRNDWSNIKDWIKEKWDKGYHITSCGYNGTKWTVVMSVVPNLSTQGYLWVKDTDALKSKIQTNIWDKGYCLQLIEFGQGEYFVVYCKYKDNKGRAQNWIVEPSDVNNYIKARWDNSQNIAYIGGGHSSSTSNSSTAYNNQQLSYPNNNGQTWREELEYGMFAINKGNPNGVRTRTIYRACAACRGTSGCSNCRGTGMCTICYGQGGIVTPGYGTYIPCAACGYTGRCGICHGSGKCVCASTEYPGYMPGSTLVIGPNGQVISNSRDFDSGSLSSSKSSYSSGTGAGGTCPKCHGRRFETQSYQYAAGSNAGWMQPYHNSSGSSCPYCGHATDHYHYPCSECRGYGHK